MFKNILQSVTGFEIWAIISMLIFLALFILIIYWVIKSDKNFIGYMSNLPLEEEKNIINN